MSYRERKGVLFIADIGGYTEFLQHEELQHAQAILTRLLEAIVDAAPEPLELVKFEGDAVFFVAEDEPGIGTIVVDTVRAMFEAFHRKQRETTGSLSCHCAGCSCASRMMLKFVAHHGSFGEHEIRGLREVIGPEVILLHRLLKNSVSVREYALFTDALARRLDPDALPLTGHKERYDHIGDVNAAVWDLAPLCEGAH
jgi:hypothetical protein